MTAAELLAWCLVGLGLLAGAYIAAQRPVFWIEFASRVFYAILPRLLRRMSPEDEAAWRACIRRNGRWNHMKRRCE